MGNDKRIIKKNFLQGKNNKIVTRNNNKNSKDGYISKKGEVLKSFGNGIFQISLDNTDMEIVCVLSGKMRLNNIKILPGDKVEVEISVYDIKKGRIIRRL